MITAHSCLLVVSIVQLALLIVTMRELYLVQQQIARPLAEAEKVFDSAKHHAEKIVDPIKEAAVSAGVRGRELIDKLAAHVKKATRPKNQEL